MTARAWQANAEIAATIRGARHCPFVIGHSPFPIPLHVDRGLWLQPSFIRLVGVEDLGEVAAERALGFVHVFYVRSGTIDDLVGRYVLNDESVALRSEGKLALLAFSLLPCRPVLPHGAVWILAHCVEGLVHLIIGDRVLPRVEASGGEARVQVPGGRLQQERLVVLVLLRDRDGNRGVRQQD